MFFSYSYTKRIKIIMNSQSNKFSSSLLPKLSIGTKGEPLDINTNIFEQIEASMNKGNKFILLQDEYYNDFYDNEISLFFIFYKIIRCLKGYEQGKDNNTEFLFLSDTKKFLSCRNEYNLYFKQEKHFLDKVSGEPGRYSSKLFQNKTYNKLYNFIMLTGSQGFCQKLIKVQDVLPVDIKSKEKAEYNNKHHYWEKLFILHAKNIRDSKKFVYDQNFSNNLTHSEKNLIDCSLFNNLYFLQKEYGTVEEELDGIHCVLKEFLIDRQRKIGKLNESNSSVKEKLRNMILVIHIKNKNYKENYKSLLKKFSTDNEWMKLTMYFKNIIIISPLWFKKEITDLSFSNIEKIKINSCLIDFNKNNKNIFMFNNSNRELVKSLNLLNKIFEKIKFEQVDDYNTKHLYKKIREDIILNDFGLKNNLLHIKDVLFLLLRKSSDINLIDIMKPEIDNLFLEQKEEKLFDIFDWIQEQIEKYDYKNIYINHSKHYVRKYQKEYFIETLTQQLKNLNINVCDFDKNYPISTHNDNKTLILNIGQDWETNYFIGKIDCLFIVDVFGWSKVQKKVEKIKDINFIPNKNIDYLLNDLHEIKSEINDIFYNHDNEQCKKQFTLINTVSKKQLILNEDKRVFYSIEKNGSFGENSLGEIFDIGFDQIYTFCLEYHMEELREIWDSLQESMAIKKEAIRKEIKEKIHKKLKYSKTYGTKLSFYKYHADKIKFSLNLKLLQKNIDFNLIKKESSTIDNLKIWVESDSLPQKRNVFEALLEYIGYDKDISMAWHSLRKEIASNQQEGRNKNQELNELFKEGFSVEKFEKKYDFEEDAFHILLNEIKNRNLNKLYSIKMSILDNSNSENEDE